MSGDVSIRPVMWLSPARVWTCCASQRPRRAIDCIAYEEPKPWKLLVCTPIPTTEDSYDYARQHGAWLVIGIPGSGTRGAEL